MATKLKVKSKGAQRFADKQLNEYYRRYFDQKAREMVHALEKATPSDTGETSESWSYEVEVKDKYAKITFKNSNIQNGYNVAVLLNYGHATSDGGYVRGTNFVEKALKPYIYELEKDNWFRR